MTKRKVVFFALGFLALELFLIGFVDKPLSLYVNGLGQTNPDLIGFFWSYTDFGKSFWYLWPAGVCILMCAVVLRIGNLSAGERAKIASIGEKMLFLFAAVAISGLITDAIKPLLGRARPLELIRDGFYGFRSFSFKAVWNSMPSGHSTTAFALAIVLTGFFPRWRPFWLFLAVLLALSRVMVNVHFLSDTIFGATVGVLTVYALERAWRYNGIVHARRCIFPIDRKNATP